MSNVPEIRFKGYTNAWGQCKLGEALSEKVSNGIMNKPGRNELNIKHINVVNLYSPSHIHLDELEYINATESDMQRCNIEVGDIFLTRSSLKVEGIAYANILLDESKLVFDDHIMRIKLKENFEPFFVKEALYHSPTKKEFMTKAKTGTMTTIGQEDISSSLLAYPTKAEQTAIGNFFRTLDNTLTFYKRKLDGLKELKKGYLQQMFPQNGESVPRVRFNGFFDDWEEVKICDVADTSFGGGTPSTTNDEFWNGDIPWLQSSDLTEHDVVQTNLRKYITQSGLLGSAAKLIPANSIAIVTRVGVGKLCLIPFKYATSQDFFSLSGLKTDKWFAVYTLYNKLQKEVISVQGTSIKGITKDELLNKTIYIPLSTAEQIAVGSFFHNLDIQITAHSRKLEQLKKLKSAYLQKMFI